MTNLVQISNNQVVVSSRSVAEHFDKEHKNVLRDIRGLLNFEPSLEGMFFESEYTNEQNKKQPMYLMNRNGFSLLVMGFTGKEALQWKIKYIEAFNNMEEALKQIPKMDKDVIACKEKELKLRESELWLRLADRIQNKEYKKICESYAANTLADGKVLPLPEIKEKTYSATEIGEILGVSANKIGAIAKKHNLKTEKYGKWFLDKSRYSNKEVETFRYYKATIEVFRTLISGAVA